ncbi:MAG: single-stranded DNA-binding protein, partial [Roseinatronobacter sp.]
KPATWYDCAIWGKRGEALEQHIRKGGSLTLIGRHTVRVHDGKAYQGINVDDLTFNASSKRDDEQGADQSGGGRADYDDEIGF